MFKIKKNILLPKNISETTTYKKERIYPFSDMTIGDCFDVPVDNINFHQKQANILSAIRNQKTIKKIPVHAKFTTRHIKEENVMRVWRIK